MAIFSINSASANTEGQKQIEVETHVVDNENKLPSNYYICFANQVEHQSTELGQNFLRLREKYSHLIVAIDSQLKNCFSPESVPHEARASFDQLLVNTEKETKVVGNFNVSQLTQNKNSKFMKKIWKAELLSGTAQGINMGVLYALPRSFTNWKSRSPSDMVKNFGRAWTTLPVIDKDDWYVNLVGHPYAGAYYYNALRSQGGTPLQSFLFSSVQSAIWEYGVESFAEQPSINDLIITPIVGSFVGELAHQATIKMRRGKFTLAEKIIVTVINPTYILNNGYK
jgi:hypothetical protein